MKNKNSLLAFRKITHLLLLSLIFTLCGFSATPLHTSYLLNHVGSNTVFIRSPKDAVNQGSATGFEVIAPSGKIYTLTNAHVCALQKDGVVLVEEKNHSERLIPKRVIEVYTENDLCLVEGLDNYGGLELASSWSIGDVNFAVGYPLGGPMNLSSGLLRELDEVEIVEPEVQLKDCTKPHESVKPIDTLFGSFEFCTITRQAIGTNIQIFPGNSGSPMVNFFGHVTGVIFASNSQTNWGSAVGLEDVKQFLKAY